MRVPLSWLQEHLPIQLTAERVAEILTRLGLEVEARHELGHGLRGAVVATIVGLEPLGRSLRRVTLRMGEERHLVVSGAPNLAVGQKVVWAPPGAQLPDGRTLEVASFLGVRSEGMLLSAEEMGIGEEAEGILVLPEDAPEGVDVVRHLGLPEVVLEIALTPSFATFAQSIVGIARELAAALQLERLSPPQEAIPPAGEPWREQLSLVVPDKDLCPQYVGLVAECSGRAASPFWLSRRLWAAGLRGHALPVDLTNYLLWEFGHPVHAFDLDRITPPLAVRTARTGERLTLLDGREVELSEEDLIIADAKGPLALAGVMGGLDSAVRPETERVLFEVAVFAPDAVRRTALRHGVRSEAMLRFEKGVDPEDWPQVLGRLAALLHESGGRVVGLALEHGRQAPARRQVTFRASQVERLLGLRLSTEEIRELLGRLGFAVTGEGAPFQVTIPSYRHDLEGEADLVEEVARLYGYDRIPEATPPAVSAGRLSEESVWQRQLRVALTGFGLTEVVSYSWVSREEAEAFAEVSRLVSLANPLREGEGVLRPSLLPRLLRAIAQNLARQVAHPRLFEIGKVFWQTDGGIQEEERVALAGVGWWMEAAPTTPAVPFDVWRVKGLLMTLARRLWRSDVSVHPVETPVSYLHPGRQAVIVVQGREVGYLGEVHPRLLELWELPRGVVVAEWPLADLTAETPRARLPLPRFPAVRRDLSIVVPEELPYGRLETAIWQAGVPELRQIRLFDLYRGPNLPPGTKSFAVALWFRSDTGTLTEEAVNQAVDTILKEVVRLGGRLRT